MKHKKGKNWNRDETGRPVNRSNSWGERNDKDVKRCRREWKQQQGNTGHCNEWTT
jgi:hypothetical protein